MISTYQLILCKEKLSRGGLETQLFFRLVELSIINSMIVFYKLFPDQISKLRVNKDYRLSQSMS